MDAGRSRFMIGAGWRDRDFSFLPDSGPQSVTPPAPLFVPLLAETPPEPPPKRPKACAEIVIETDGAVVHVRGRPEGEVLNDIFSALRRTRSC